MCVHCTVYMVQCSILYYYSVYYSEHWGKIFPLNLKNKSQFRVKMTAFLQGCVYSVQLYMVQCSILYYYSVYYSEQSEHWGKIFPLKLKK